MIIFDKNVCGGKPIISGTRITVDTIIDLINSDWVISEILYEYPSLTKQDIEDCLHYHENSN
jgi:uncharacterized protein (DUF433 family)